MPAESPRRRGRTPLLLGLLALLAAFIAPPASADHDRGVWYRWAHDAATGTYNEGVAINGAGRISYTYKEVGHQHGNSSNTCMKMSYKVKSPSGGFDLTVDGRNVTGAHVTLTNTAIWLSGAQGGWGNVKVRNPNPTAGTVTVSIEVKNEGGQNIGNLPCSAGETNDIFFTITVAATPVWTTLRWDRNAANGDVSPVRVSRSTSGGVIGQRFHRFYTGCNRISVGLRSGASDALELSVYSSGSPSTGSLSDLRMQDG
ncbi:MAG: hypothetical protein ISN28_04500 [Ectothiorhodospiraceae bacterium AqS1]|nr:hypothetical protein [Ectothiorhodospiraceae bacterium AqS1]